MTPILLALTLALVQQPAPPADTGEAGRLRREIEDRFAQHVQQQLRLSPDQATKLRATQERFGERRRGLMRQQVDRRMALNDQMQPGVAANSDSVAKLVVALTDHRVAYAQTFKDEMRELSTILNPVQRGQYMMLRDRLMQRVQEIMQNRAERPSVLQAPLRRRPTRP